MTNLSRVKVLWLGGSGGPGVTTFYTTDPNAFVGRVRPFLTAVKAYVPTFINLQLQNFGDVIDPLDGKLVGAWGSAAVEDNQGTATGSYAQPTGAMIRWETGTIFNGHRLRGKTYIVPIRGSAYGLDGKILAADKTALTAAASALISTGTSTMVVWNRPKMTKVVGGPDTVERAGGYSIVTGGACIDKVAVLTSRRD